jgi:tetratricopeptide (TPR) repeat protein
MLFILSFWSYTKGRLAQGNHKRWLWYTGSTLAWLVSLGCKQITVTLPLLVFIYEWYFFQDLSKDWLRRSLKWILGIAVLIGIVALIYTDFKPFEKLSRFHDFSSNEFTATQRALTQLRVVVYYISLLFYPHPSRLNLDYDFPLSYSMVDPFTTLLSLIILLSLVMLSVYLAKRQRLISFCILWFFGNLVIESSVIPLALIFEHRLYLPSMLVSLLLVILSQRYIKPRWLSAGIACALILLLSYGTFQRNKVWQDEISLWADVVKKSPGKARPYTNLAVAQTKHNMLDEARQNYLKAIELNPIFFKAHFELGNLLEKQGKSEEAIEYFRNAIRINPHYVKAYNSLGMAFLKQDQRQAALDYFRKALQINPNFSKAHNNLGVALLKQGKPAEAIEHYQTALHLDPDLPEAQLNLGNALLEQGKTEQGISHIQKAVELKPDYVEAHNNLGGHLLQQGKIDQALAHFNAVLRINPAMSQAHNNIGIIMVHKGNINEALFHFQEAVRIDPGFELAHDNLRRALAIQQNQMDMELEKIRAALKSNPDDPQLNYDLGNLYLGKGELNAAIGQFQKAISIRPNFPAALNNLAMAHTFGRQYDQALQVFLQLIALQPDNPASYYNVAVLYALGNNVTESLLWLRKAIAKGYDNWNLIKTDKDLENIRSSEGYRELVKGH